MRAGMLAMEASVHALVGATGYRLSHFQRQ